MKDGFLFVPDNTGLILSADGVPVFKSAHGSLWPVYLVATAIPPEHRTKVQNMIVAALWHGPCQPIMDHILSPVLKSINALKEQGITIPGTGKVVRLWEFLIYLPKPLQTVQW